MNDLELPFGDDDSFVLTRLGSRRVADVNGLARLGDPDTSQEAARKITGRTERLLLAQFQVHVGRGYTADELCAELPTVYGPTLKSALSRLANHHLIVDTGARRQSQRGVAMIVWRLAP